MLQHWLGSQVFQRIDDFIVTMAAAIESLRKHLRGLSWGEGPLWFVQVKCRRDTRITGLSSEKDYKGFLVCVGFLSFLPSEAETSSMEPLSGGL